jgi:hypothetical protein
MFLFTLTSPCLKEVNLSGARELARPEPRRRADAAVCAPGPAGTFRVLRVAVLVSPPCLSGDIRESHHVILRESAQQKAPPG